MKTKTIAIMKLASKPKWALKHPALQQTVEAKQIDEEKWTKFKGRSIVSGKRPGGVLPEKLGRGVRPASQNLYPIYDQNLRFSLPYLWPGQTFDTLFMTRLLDH